MAFILGGKSLSDSFGLAALGPSYGRCVDKWIEFIEVAKIDD
jgi:hypothetical protein